MGMRQSLALFWLLSPMLYDALKHVQDGRRRVRTLRGLTGGACDHSFRPTTTKTTDPAYTVVATIKVWQGWRSLLSMGL
jgi:hypothetical protein